MPSLSKRLRQSQKPREVTVLGSVRPSPEPAVRDSNWGLARVVAVGLTLTALAKLWSELTVADAPNITSAATTLHSAPLVDLGPDRTSTKPAPPDVHDEHGVGTSGDSVAASRVAEQVEMPPERPSAVHVEAGPAADPSDRVGDSSSERTARIADDALERRPPGAPGGETAPTIAAAPAATAPVPMAAARSGEVQPVNELPLEPTHPLSPEGQPAAPAWSQERSCAVPRMPRPPEVPTPLGGRGQFSEGLRRAWAMVEHAERVALPDASYGQSPHDWNDQALRPWLSRRTTRIHRARQALTEAEQAAEAGESESAVRSALHAHLWHALVADQTRVIAPAAVLSDSRLCEQYLAPDAQSLASARAAYRACVSESGAASRGPVAQLGDYCRTQLRELGE